MEVVAVELAIQPLLWTGLATVLMAVLLLNCTKYKRRKFSPTTQADKSTAHNLNAPPAAPAADDRQRCTILFGTQTGTAERFAKSLKSQLESKYGAHTAFDVVDIEHYDAPTRLIKEKLVFFLMATYGDGEPTDDAAAFYNWVTSEAEDQDVSLDGVSFGVFGLGNRQYEHFCAVGKHVHKALQKLGAEAVVRLGMGDDDVDIDEDFDAWSSDVFAALAGSPLLKAGGEATRTAASIAAYLVQEIVDAPSYAVDVIQDGAGTSHLNPHLATITAVRELHSCDSDRSCVHVEVDISGCTATYEAGDHVAVLAENSPDVVATTAAALGASLDACFELSLPPGNHDGLSEPPTGPMTLRRALARYADLSSPPSKAALAALAAFAKDHTEAARLSELASISGRDAFHSYIVTSKRSLLEVLQEFPSARPSIGAFFAVIAPRLQPRFYSISSSPALHPRSVHITCAVVKERMPTGRMHEGVASTWLARAQPGDKVPVFLRHSAFKLPRDPATPIVMVGPGTGLAPFRGFVQERQAAASATGRRGATPKAGLGPAILFFGCRRRDHDYIYREELEAAVKSGVLTELHLAFSREGAAKDYVQHRMLTAAKDIWPLLAPAPAGRGGWLYVCGDAKNMAKDVHSALHDIVRAATGCGPDEAEKAVKVLADGGRYHKDVW
jgi:NADPH-ferrihemoprotein reductase